MCFSGCNKKFRLSESEDQRPKMAAEDLSFDGLTVKIIVHFVSFVSKRYQVYFIVCLTIKGNIMVQWQQQTHMLTGLGLNPNLLIKCVTITQSSFLSLCFNVKTLLA